MVPDWAILYVALVIASVALGLLWQGCRYLGMVR